MVTQAGQVFQIKKNPNTDEYYLEYRMTTFNVPNKLYGKTNMYINRFWRSFVFSKKSMGVLLTGDSGSGKTMLANAIGNVGLANGLNVIIVSELKASIELISFIDHLPSSIILFDEFGKVFDLNFQDKMLTMMSNTEGSKKLFMLTENDVRDVNRFIRNRPGRVRYHIDFNRVEKDIIIEYCNDRSIDKQYLNDMLEKYDESLTFSFDHMMALVVEHIENPESTFAENLNILNLKVLTKRKEMVLLGITKYDEKTKDYTDTNVKLGSSANMVTKSEFNKGRLIYLNTEDYDSIKVSKSTVTNITDGIITCIVDKKYKVILET